MDRSISWDITSSDLSGEHVASIFRVEEYAKQASGKKTEFFITTAIRTSNPSRVSLDYTHCICVGCVAENLKQHKTEYIFSR
jgi:hypothetical protein